ncbi:MAG: ABC-2 family transporter protein [Anaerolineales bacterium]|nr:ABC-2 family transporter protein [Anaerolineales bacterium]
MYLIFQRLWQVNWAEQWQYRANMLMYLLYWLVSPIMYLAVWTSIANANGSVNGFTANDFITYYMTLLICDQVTSNIVIHIFGYKIQDGTLSGELVKPIHPMLTNALINNIAFKVLMILGFLPIWVILFFLFKPDFSSVALSGVLLSIPAMILGFFVSYMISAAITALAFWTTRVYSIHEFYFALILLFSGQFVPLPLMPKLVQDIAQYLPFQLFMYYPIQLILGKLSTEQIIQGFVSGVIWLGISTVLFNWVWKNGVKRYSAVGA